MSRWVKPALAMLFCFLCSLAVTGVFVPSGPIRWIAAILGTLPMIPALSARLARREERARKEQCGFLFQVLLSRISIGNTLESAFSVAARETGQTYGVRSPIAGALRDLTSDLGSRTPVAQAIARFTSKLRCVEAETVFSALSSSRFIGSGVMELFRTGQRMISESLSMEDDVEAETAQRRTEALAIAAMPPVIAALLRQLVPGYLDPVFSTPAGAWIMAGAYIAAALSAAMVLRILAGQSSDRPQSRKKPGRPRDVSKPISSIARFCSMHLPSGYRIRLSRAFDLIGDVSSERIARHIGRKLLIIAAGAALGALLHIAGGSWPLIPGFAVVLALLHDRDLYRVSAEAKRNMLRRFPVFLGMMAAILHAGISLSNALDLCVSSLPDPEGPLGMEISEIRAGVRAGQPAANGFDRLAARMAIPEVQAALSLIAQFERAGGRELISLLRMQVPTCWSLYRNAMRKRMEDNAVRLLIPMTLDLLAVLAVTGLPALLSLRI